MECSEYITFEIKRKIQTYRNANKYTGLQRCTSLRGYYHIYSNKCPGALQFTFPINDILETKCGQIYKICSFLKPFLMAFGPLFHIKHERGLLLEREAFIKSKYSI